MANEQDFSQLPDDVQRVEEKEHRIKEALLRHQRKKLLKVARRAIGLGTALFDPSGRPLTVPIVLAGVENLFGDLAGTMEDILYFSAIASIETIQSAASSAATKTKDVAKRVANAAKGKLKSVTSSEAREILLHNIPPSATAANKAFDYIEGLFEVDLFDDRLGTLTGVRNAFDAPVNELLAPFDKLKSTAVAQFRAELAEAAANPIPQKELAKRLARALSLPASQAMTLANTGLSAMTSEVNNYAAERMTQLGEQVVMVHTGPAPQRSFCKRCYKKAFTLDQINRMTNGQNLSVKTYVGGYNCVHGWRAMPLSQAERFGFPVVGDEFVNDLNADFPNR